MSSLGQSASVLVAREVTKIYRMGEVDVHALHGVDVVVSLHDGRIAGVVGDKHKVLAKELSQKFSTGSSSDARRLKNAQRI